MAQLGKAYIEVRADLSKFPAELKAELQKALHEGVAGVSFTDLEDKAGKAGEEAANRVGSGFEKTSKSRLKKTGEHAGEDIGLGLFATLRNLFSSNNSGSGFLSTAGSLFSGFAKSAEDGFEQLSSVGSKIGDLGGKIGSAFSAIGSGIQVGMYVLAVPAVAALIAVLVQLAGILFILPAAIGVVLAAVAPLVIAFQGISEAIGAGFSGDVDKFNAALKGLAPSARSVVREIVGLKPAFDAIKRSTQQAFFAPLIGSFKALGTTLLPALQKDLALAAGALGVFVQGFLELLSEPEIIKDIGLAFSSLAEILGNIGPVAVELFGSIFGLIRTGLPFVELFAEKLAVFGQTFVDFFARAQGAGKIRGLIEGAIEPLKEIIKLVAVVGDLFFTIFGNGGIQKSGNDFLNYLIKAVGLLDAFFKSAEGKKVLADLADAIEHTGVIVVGLASVLIVLLEAIHYVNAGLTIAVKAVAAFFGFIGGVAVTAGKAIGGFFADLGKAVANFFTKQIPAAFDATVGFFKSIGSAIGGFFTDTVPGWFNSLTGFFQALPGKAGNSLNDLRIKIRDALENALRDAFETTLRGIGRMVGLFLAAPFLIKLALTQLGQVIHDAFFDALHGAETFVSESIDNIGHYFTQVLPGQISFGLTFVKNFVVSQFLGLLDFFASIGIGIGHAFEAIYHSIVDNVSAAAHDAKTFVVNGFNSLMDFLNGLPGRVEALGPKLLNAARDLGRKIGEGLKDIGNFATNIGKDIVNTVKSGINHVIDGINSGISDIDNALPIGLPRLPHLARGGIIDSPTVALLGEGSRREVVLPLTNPARAQELAQQSGLTKILAGGGGGTTVHVTAILGTGQILEVLDQRVETALENQGTELAYGARS